MVVRVIQIARLLIILASRHRTLVFENLALRQQLTVYHRTRPKPTIRWPDRLFWVGLRLAGAPSANRVIESTSGDPCRAVHNRTARMLWIGQRHRGVAGPIAVRNQRSAMIALKNIVATDFGQPADAALAYGRALARTFTATLHVVHVVGTLASFTYGVDGYVATLPDMQREMERAARKQLDDLLIDNDERPLPTRRVLISSNAPALAIVEYAGREHIDLVVTGTHGRCAVAHLLLGSVAERIVRIARCPVLTVRHPEHEFVVADALVATPRPEKPLRV